MRRLPVFQNVTARLAAQAKQDKNAELSAAFLSQAEDYQAQAEHWQAAI